MGYGDDRHGRPHTRYRPQWQFDRGRFPVVRDGLGPRAIRSRVPLDHEALSEIDSCGTIGSELLETLRALISQVMSDGDPPLR